MCHHIDKKILVCYNVLRKGRYKMKKRILIVCDLEGVNNVVGEPYSGLTRESEQWKIAKHQAALEINAADIFNDAYMI